MRRREEEADEATLEERRRGPTSRGHPLAVPQVVLGVCAGPQHEQPPPSAGRREGIAGSPLGLMFLGDRADPGGAWACIVAREVGARMTLATMLPDLLMAFTSEVGCLHGDIVVWSDQGASIKYIVDDVGKRRASEGGGQWIVEHSPVGPSASTSWSRASCG